MIRNTNSSGFSLVELLAVTSVVLVLTGIAAISARGTLQAAQMTSMQRELQHLNGTSQAYLAAGGVLPKVAQFSPSVAATEAVTKLSEPLQFVGDQQLNRMLVKGPEFQRIINGIEYTSL